MLICLLGVGSGLNHTLAAAPVGPGWQRAADPLIAAARPVSDRLARLIETWPLPDECGRLDRQVIVSYADELAAPDWLPAAAEPLWQRFVELRRERAAAWFEQAVAAIEPAADGPPASASEAIRLLARVVREDPDHERARAGLGYLRDDSCWVWPNAARRRTRGETYTSRSGWLPRGRRGGPPDAGDGEHRGSPPPLTRAVTFQSDHWEIRSTAGLAAAAALAERLERTRLVWLQAFGGFVVDARELRQRLAGRRRNRPTAAYDAVLLANRQQYIAELQQLEPRIAQTLGIYWTPTRTAWFFEGDDPPALTIEHEATHQLFAEYRPTSRLAGERCGMWALEAVACYMESLRPTASGFTLGGRDAGRVPAARERLLDDGFFIPLRELCGLGRVDLQRDPRLPQIYSQISGLADFLLNGDQGRFRDAFLAYLNLLYQAKARPDSLWQLCGRSPETLDEAYREYLRQP